MYLPACSNRCGSTCLRITHRLLLWQVISILALCASLLAALPAWAGNDEPIAQGSQSSNAGAGAGDWAGPGKVVGPPDNSCANMGAVGKANLTYNFDFNIPPEATITGATAFIKAGENGEQTIGVQLATNASVDPPETIGDQRSLLVPAAGSGTCLATTVRSLGTTLSDWGVLSLDPASVNSSEFGLVFTKLQNSSIKVDSICLQIAYEVLEGPVTQQECFTETPVETNSINIVKTVVGTAPDTDWAFDGSGDIGGNFTLPAAGGFRTAVELADDTYTITETPKPGYTVTSECFIDDLSVVTGAEEISIAVEGSEFATCVFTNTYIPPAANFTVTKTFDDGATDPVTINLVCNDGNVTTNDLQAAPGSPAVFEVTGWTIQAPTCTATESNVPAGYTADSTGCTDVLLVDPGECTIANTANTGTFTVRKLYTAGTENPVSVTASCSSPAVVTNNPQMVSPSASAVFAVTRVVPGETTCTASEIVPAGYEADESDCQDSDPIDGGCAITNSPVDRATFRVTKDFTDDNPSEVTVSIDCTTGLILDQSKPISESKDVVFVVTEFDPGELNCDISEVVPEGYSPAYDASILNGESDAPTEDELGCYFDNVVTGEFRCSIVNTPDPVDVVIEKDWVIEGSGGNGVDKSYKLELYCDAEIVGGSNYCDYTTGEPSGSISMNDTWCDTFSGDDSDIFTAQVIPEYPDSQCWVKETVNDNSVEIDNDCLNLVVSAGNGDSCVVTNTVFFEGIPTLGQYGKILLVLLMLGMGIVGFRRIS